MVGIVMANNYSYSNTDKLRNPNKYSNSDMLIPIKNQSTLPSTSNTSGASGGSVLLPVEFAVTKQELTKAISEITGNLTAESVRTIADLSNAIGNDFNFADNVYENINNIKENMHNFNFATEEEIDNIINQDVDDDPSDDPFEGCDFIMATEEDINNLFK